MDDGTALVSTGEEAEGIDTGVSVNCGVSVDIDSVLGVNSFAALVSTTFDSSDQVDELRVEGLSVVVVSNETGSEMTDGAGSETITGSGGSMGRVTSIGAVSGASMIMSLILQSHSPLGSTSHTHALLSCCANAKGAHRTVAMAKESL